MHTLTRLIALVRSNHVFLLVDFRSLFDIPAPGETYRHTMVHVFKTKSE